MTADRSALETLEHTQDLYARYVEIAEIADLATVAREVRDDDRGQSFSPAPMGLAFTGSLRP